MLCPMDRGIVILEKATLIRIEMFHHINKSENFALISSDPSHEGSKTHNRAKVLNRKGCGGASFEAFQCACVCQMSTDQCGIPTGQLWNLIILLMFERKSLLINQKKKNTIRLLYLYHLFLIHIVSMFTQENQLITKNCHAPIATIRESTIRKHSCSKNPQKRHSSASYENSNEQLVYFTFC